MAKTLVLAEKPSVGRDIARVLGASQKGEGFLSGEKWVVTWAIGHLVALCEPEELDPRYKKWRMDQLPILPEQLKTKVLSKTKAQFAVIQKLLASPEIERVVCATDSGREGELIFRYIYQQARCKKPVDRLWISSMTDAAIREGFATLKPDSAYDALYRSARCRSEADWLVGMNASRAFTLRYDVLLSVGRVQTPTLNLLVQRDREIAAFVPQDYWEIRAGFGDYAGVWLHPETKEARTFDQAQAQQVAQKVRGKPARVSEVQREQKRMPPPQLYDLTTLQREANRKLGLSAAKTLEAAQALYEKHKLITYPRTDSRYLTHDMAAKIPKAISAVPAEYQALAAPLTAAASLPMPRRVYDDAKVSDHHAIVPTGNRAVMAKLPAPERGVYDLVVRRLLCVFYPDYEYEAARVLTECEGECFKSTGTVVLQEGWKALYRGEKAEAKEEEPLPDLKVGDARTCHKAAVSKKKTKPPAPHTDATLLAAMEHAGRELPDEQLREMMKDSGLGTPATRAAIIERLIQVGYAQRRGKALVSTSKGDRLIQVAPPEITSAETTGRWEKALSDIARSASADAQARPERFMQGIRRYAAFLVEAAQRAPDTVQFDPEPMRGRAGRAAKSRALAHKCPLCGQGTLTENSKAFGCSRWREGCKYTVWKDALARQGGPELTSKLMNELLSGRTVDLPAGQVFWVDGRPAFRPAAQAGEPPRGN